MINLLAPESKQSIRAARQNVVLRRYVIFIGFVAVLVFSSFGAGYYLTTQESSRLRAEIEAKSGNIDEYKAAHATSKQFSKDLSMAKTIFANEVVFSNLLVDITKTLPPGVVLNELNLSNDMFGKDITLSARSRNPESGPLNLKARLEESPLFSNVKILNIEQPISKNPEKLQPIERAYPVTFELSATLDAKAGRRQTEEVKR